MEAPLLAPATHPPLRAPQLFHARHLSFGAHLSSSLPIAELPSPAAELPSGQHCSTVVTVGAAAAHARGFRKGGLVSLVGMLDDAREAWYATRALPRATRLTACSPSPSAAAG